MTRSVGERRREATSRMDSWLQYGVVALAATSGLTRGAGAAHQSGGAALQPGDTTSRPGDTAAAWEPRRALLEGARSVSLHLRSHNRTSAADAVVPTFTALQASDTPEEHVLGGLPLIYGGLWMAKRGSDFYVRDDDSAPGRNPSVITMLNDVNRWHPALPDFGPVFACTEGYQSVCQGNAPDHNIPGAHSFAIHLSKNRPPVGWRPKPHLIPDSTFQDWSIVGIHDYDATCRNMSRAGDLPPETSLAGWVGNIETNPMRVTLMDIAAAHPEHIEAVNTGQWVPKTSGEGITVSLGKQTSMTELVARYAYLIDIEGAYSSFRLKMLYHSNRPVLVQERRFDEFWTRRVRPWVHYIPVAYDLHDLSERVEWLKFNPEEGARIAAQARDFARGHLQRGHAIERWRVAILETVAAA